MQIGYIGLGAMGGSLAGRLLLSEYKLTIWDINSSAVADFEKRGVSTAPSAAELARRCDIVMLCLPRSADVRQAIFCDGGLAEGLSPGKIVIDQTSGTPSEARQIAKQLAERGVAMIDAPVSGGIEGAVAGTITIMASGPDDVYDRVFPVLSAISPNIFRCGTQVGTGQAMKLVNNVLNFGCRVATFEVMAMGRKMGLSLETMTNILNKGSGRNQTSKVILQGIVEGKPAGKFFMSLMLKDINQALALGMECGAPMPLATILRGLVQIGLNKLGERAQMLDIIGVIGSMAGTEIVNPELNAAAQTGIAAGGTGKDLRIGYVGLGAMGGALARRLMLSHKMQVFDIRPQVVSEFEAEGAVGAQNLASLARSCDVIMICVPTSGEVCEVLFGNGGLAQGLAPGKIIVDQTTGDPAQTCSIAADLQKLGVSLVDAPVSGSPLGTNKGTITIMCGGPPESFAKVHPILESVSPNIVYCGQTGTGHVAKLVNNTVAACNRLYTYEAVAMGFKYGLSIEDMSKVINKSTGWSVVSEKILPALVSYGQTSNFQIGLMAKDLKLASQMAISCGAPMLIANAVREFFEVGVNKFGGTANIDDMCHLFEDMADVKFGCVL